MNTSKANETGAGQNWLTMGAADFDTGAEQVQGSLFGAELAGPDELAGQGSLFAEGITHP
jgi:hypothetical protein